MNRVTGIGGIFLKAKDPAMLRAWYKTHLGIDVQSWGGTAFRWLDSSGHPIAGKTAYHWRLWMTICVAQRRRRGSHVSKLRDVSGP